MIKIHIFPDMTSGEVYDETQCNDKIKDGDILVIPDEKIVGFLMQAWPIAVTKEHGNLHNLKDGGSWEGVCKQEHKDYTESYRRCLEVAKEQGYRI